MQIAAKLAEEGFTVASIEYRHIAEANYINIVGDVKAAIRYLRAHADELFKFARQSCVNSCQWRGIFSMTR